MNKTVRNAGGVFDGLITSNTRIRILMRLFLNPDQKAYLRELSGEFRLSSSLVSGELKQLAISKLLKSERNGRQVYYHANKKHALFPELHSMVRKALGMDRILESVIERLGNVERAILIDDYAAGKDTGLIDLVLVGDINHENLADLVAKTERYIERKIRPLTVRREEIKRLERILAGRPQLVLWERGKAPYGALKESSSRALKARLPVRRTQTGGNPVGSIPRPRNADSRSQSDLKGIMRRL